MSLRNVEDADILRRYAATLSLEGAKERRDQDRDQHGRPQNQGTSSVSEE
jgi:hypothetical protein